MGCRRLSKRRGKEGGAAAVEFALLLPLLLLLVFGIIQYGLYFWAMQGGSDIARDAARRSAVGAPADCNQLRADVVAAVDGLTGTGSTVEFDRSYRRGVAEVDEADVRIGDTVAVDVRFQSFDLNLPFLPFIDDGLVVSTAEARVDYLPSTVVGCT